MTETIKSPYAAELNLRVKRKGGITTESVQLFDPTTGEIKAEHITRSVQTLEREEFLKVFEAGIIELQKLNKTAREVWHEVFAIYLGEPMAHGYCATIHLDWIGEGINGRKSYISQRTYQRGLKMLIEADFLRLKQRGVYWVNPAFFFKGNRITFIKEYTCAETQHSGANHETTGATQ